MHDTAHSPTDNLTIRPFSDHDSVESLTHLLHRAYAAHAAAGRRFFASYQTPEDTRRRISRGECWLMEHHGALVGTVTLSARPKLPPGYPVTPRSGTFSQLALLPEQRAKGWGSRLLCFTEQRLAQLGADNVVIDTSSLATDLIAWYQRRGYTPIGTWTWDVTNYESIILQKPLPTPPSTNN